VLSHRAELRSDRRPCLLYLFYFIILSLALLILLRRTSSSNLFVLQSAPEYRDRGVLHPAEPRPPPRRREKSATPRRPIGRVRQGHPRGSRPTSPARFMRVPRIRNKRRHQRTTALIKRGSMGWAVEGRRGPAHHPWTS
jgi:hypothetical protein